MKIAFIGQKAIPFAYNGGVERHVENLSIRLAKNGHEVYVYCRPPYLATKEKTHQGVNLIVLPSIPTKNLDAITHTLISTFHALFQNFDVIHYHGVGPSTLSFIPRIFKPKTKIIATFHCQDRFHKKWGWFARLYLSWGEWTACHFPHKTIVVSKTLQKYCREKFRKETFYIPNGVTIKEARKSDKLKLFKLEKNKYILTVARLIKHKGIHYLIEAYKQLSEKYRSRYKLAVVGGSSYTNDYMEYLTRISISNPNIIFCGFQQEEILDQLYNNAYIYIHPSEVEGLSVTVLEAMGFGKCVLISDIPENLEIINNSGFFFKKADIKNLKDKLEELLDNPDLVEKIGKKAKEHIKKNYNWDKVAEKTESLYKSF